MKLIVGLGNPGSSYARTRHNAGFRVVERLADRHGLRFSERDYRSHVARGHIFGERIVLIRPQTYMNHSGDAVGRARRDLGVDPPGILIVYDEVDLPLGRIRVKRDGSAGGHRGAESVIQSLGGKNFPRIRIGVGRPGREPISPDYVLDRPSVSEEAEFEDAIERATDAVEVWIRDGVEEAMNRFNAARPEGSR